MHGGITIVGGGPLNITLPLIQSFTPSSVQMAKTAKPAREHIYLHGTAMRCMHQPCFLYFKVSAVCPGKVRYLEGLA